MKVKDLYDLNSFKVSFNDYTSNNHKVKRIVDMAKQKYADADGGLVVGENLVAVDPTIFEKKYPENVYVNSGVEVSNFGGIQDQVQSLRVNEQGEFTPGIDRSDAKGKFSLFGETSLIKIINMNGFAEWEDDDVERSALQNINLPSQLTVAMRKRYLQEIDKVGLLGVKAVSPNADNVALGLLNNTGFTSTASAGAINTLTAQAMYDEISNLIVNQWNDVDNIPEYMATHVFMPTRVRNELMRKTWDSSNASNVTVYSYLVENYPQVKFVATHRADVDNSDGLLTASATVAVSTSGDVLKMRIPRPLTIGKITEQGSFGYMVQAKYRIGGNDFLENAGGRILTGL